jgi:hypothetical protein
MGSHVEKSKSRADTGAAKNLMLRIFKGLTLEQLEALSTAEISASAPWRQEVLMRLTCDAHKLSARRWGEADWSAYFDNISVRMHVARQSNEHVQYSSNQ